MRFPPMRRSIHGMRSMQRSIMEDTVSVFRGEFGDEVMVSGGIPCRIDANRLFAEPADPYDANVRSLSEWTLTVPNGNDVRMADIIRVDRPLNGEKSDLISIVAIVGELVEGQTHQIVEKFFCTRPKSATPTITLVLWRRDFETDDFTDLPPQTFQLVFKRVDPMDVPLRYLQGGHSSYQGATLIGTLESDIKAGDRFSYVDPNTGDEFSGNVLNVLPVQPQRIEARVVMDLVGAR